MRLTFVYENMLHLGFQLTNINKSLWKLIPSQIWFALFSYDNIEFNKYQIKPNLYMLPHEIVGKNLWLKNFRFPPKPQLRSHYLLILKRGVSVSDVDWIINFWLTLKQVAGRLGFLKEDIIHQLFVHLIFILQTLNFGL